MESRPQVVITLVHGTWGRKTTWTQPDSRLREVLIQHLPDAEIRAFSWSGKNSPSARHKASLALSLDLRELLQLQPQALHVVIGHSHGGNVALKAVELGNLFDQMAIVCLSTPFFNVKQRFRSLTKHEVNAAQSGLAGLAVLPALFGVHISLRHPTSLSIGTLSLMLTALGLMTSVLFGQRAWSDTAERFRSTVEILVPSQARLMIVRTVADEASAAVAFFQLLTWLSSKIGMFYIRVLCLPVAMFMKLSAETRAKIKSAAAIGKKLFVAIMIALAVFAYHIQRKYHSSIAERYPWTTPSWLSFIDGDSHDRAWGPFLAGLPIIATGFAILLCSWLPFGFGPLTGALKYLITVEPTPVGIWPLYQCDSPADAEAFMHSSVYENEAALSEIGNWLDQLAKAKA
jgi:hypothetical protein